MEQWIEWVLGFSMGAVGFALGAVFASGRKNILIDSLQLALERHLCRECIRRDVTRATFNEESV